MQVTSIGLAMIASFALSPFGAPTGSDGPPGETCTRECRADPTSIISNGEFTVVFSNVEGGMGDFDSCITCTPCTGWITWNYNGGDRWRVLTTDGQALMGVGPALGVHSLEAACDDEAPPGMWGQSGKESFGPGFSAHLYCLCGG